MLPSSISTIEDLPPPPPPPLSLPSSSVGGETSKDDDDEEDSFSSSSATLAFAVGEVVDVVEDMRPKVYRCAGVARITKVGPPSFRPSFSPYLTPSRPESGTTVVLFLGRVSYPEPLFLPPSLPPLDPRRRRVVRCRLHSDFRSSATPAGQVLHKKAREGGREGGREGSKHGVGEGGEGGKEKGRRGGRSHD